MAICKFCSNEYSDERFDAGYDYCMEEDCQKIGLQEMERAFLKEYTPALLHKSNYFWIKKTDLPLLNTRADIIAGYGDQV